MRTHRTSIALWCAALLAVSNAHAASGFMINSDDPSPRDYDALHRIELSNGAAAKVGDVRASENQAPYADVEGLAMNADGQLFGIDDASKTLLRVDSNTGRSTPVDGREGNTGLPRNSNFDFGLSFDCTGALYASSDSRRSLYRLDPATGAAVLVGSEGSLGAQITGLAARWDGLYGIGSNGDENLYKIDPQTGTATLIGSLGGGLRFADGGLDFDASGNLWAIADMTGGSVNAEPSLVLQIDPSTGVAERVGTTLSGVESLAISRPICEAPEGVVPPPAIPTLDRSGLLLLSAMVALLGWVALRRS